MRTIAADSGILAMLLVASTPARPQVKESRFWRNGAHEDGALFVDRNSVERAGDLAISNIITVYSANSSVDRKFLYQKQIWRANCRTLEAGFHGVRLVFREDGRLFGSDQSISTTSVAPKGSIADGFTTLTCLAKKQSVASLNDARFVHDDSADEVTLAMSNRWLRTQAPIPPKASAADAAASSSAPR